VRAYILATYNNPPKYWVKVGYFPYYLYERLFKTRKEAEEHLKLVKERLAMRKEGKDGTGRDKN